MVTPIALRDADEVARLHRACLDGLLSRLGPLAVRSFYRGAIPSELGVGFVFRPQSGPIGGFVFGSTDPATLRREASSRRAIATAAGIAVGLVRRPSAGLDLWRSLAGAPAEGYDPAAPELTYLAVAPADRGTGIGARLMEAFDRELERRGVEVYELSVDLENVGAIGFYERLGLERVNRYEEFGTSFLRMRRRLR